MSKEQRFRVQKFLIIPVVTEYDAFGEPVREIVREQSVFFLASEETLKDVASKIEKRYEHNVEATQREG